MIADGRHEIHYLTHFVDGRYRARNYRVHLIGAGGAIPRLGYLMEAHSLYAALRKIAPDAIYQRVACAYTGICAFYARRRGVPLIWHVAHDSDVAPRLLEQVRNIPRQRLEILAVGYGARNATAIVVQTRQQADLLRQTYGRNADDVIPNFHPLPKETIDKSGPLTVTWIANLKPWKRPDAFVRLARSFSSQPEIRFVMVGAPAAKTASTAWQDSLMRSIADTSNLEYRGQLSNHEVNELLARSHIFVNTSMYEGFPNTFIQAWQRGVAVVSLHVDPDGVLEGEVTGIAAQTESGLEAAVRKLIVDPEALAGYSTRGREYALANHSLDNARRLIQLIRTHTST